MGTVEGERHEMQFAIVRAHLITLTDCPAMHGHRPVLDCHALGLAGGAGGVDDVGQVLRQHLHLRRMGRPAAQVEAVDVHYRQFVRQRQPGQLRMAEQQHHRRVAHQVGQALGRVLRIERHIGGTGLVYGQQADNHLHRTRQRHAHPLFRAHPSGAQFMRQGVGLGVQLGVGHVLVGEVQGHRVGCLARPLGNRQVHRLPPCPLGHARLPAVQQLLAFAVWQQLDLAEVARCLLGAQLFKHVQQVPVELGNGPSAEMREVEAVVQVQGLPQVDRQHQRVVGLFVVGQQFEMQAGRAGLGQGLGDRVVLEHQDAVEQRLRALPGPALNLEQRRVFMLAQGQVAVLHRLQPVPDTLLGTRAGDHRQGVDEQPQLLHRALELGRTAGHGGAETQGLLAGIALQQQQPGGLEQGVEGDFVAAGERIQALGLLCRQVDQQAVVGDDRARLRCQRRADKGVGQAGRRFQRSQLPGPEGLGDFTVLSLQPADIVAVAASSLQRLFAGVALQHLGEQLRGTPAVHENVVAGVQHVVALFLAAHQHQAQQRCLRQIEALLQLFCGQLRQCRVVVGAVTPVEQAVRQLPLFVDNLQRLRQLALPGEAGAQDVMGIQRRLPGLTETLGVEAIDVQAHLVDVVASGLFVEGVKEHALLHRRQREEVLDLLQRQPQAVQLTLIESRQREVGRRRALGAGLQAMLNQGL
ncbi:hypothetical protein D3C80_928460 [compost metagenome]